MWSKTPKTRSLMAHITVTMVFWALSGYILAVLVLGWSANVLIEESLKKQAAQLVPMFDELGTGLYFSESSYAVKRIRQAASRYRDVDFVRYYDAKDLKLLGEYTKTPTRLETLPAAALSRFQRQHVPEHVYLTTRTFGVVDSIRIVSPITTRSVRGDDLLDMSGDTPRETINIIGYLEIGMDLEPTRRFVIRSLMLVGLILFTILAVSLLAGRQMIRTALRPLLNLRTPLERLAKGDFDAPVQIQSGDREIEAIGKALESTIKALRQRERETHIALREKSDAEEANRAKTQFLAHMSHEIRTPLHGILGFLSLLGKTDLTTAQRDYLNTTEVSAKTLLTVINDVLDLSKIEAGKFSMETSPFNLRETIEECVSLYAANAQQKGLDLILLFHHDVPVNVIGDPGRLTQILGNLVSNAVKFTDRGEIAVTVSATAVEAGRVSVRVAVSDTGPGIPDEAIPRLFQPFSQADATTTRRYGGTGLGLVIAKRLVELMGGHIGVESSPEGSRFHFDLSLNRQPGVDTALQPWGPESLRVLIVSSNTMLTEALREQLRTWGVEPLAASSAQEALAALRAGSRSPWDVALVDSHLSDCPPESLIEQIEDALPDRSLPVILLAGAAERLSRLPYLEAAGIQYCLDKPPKSGDLLDTLNQALIQTARGRADGTRPNRRTAPAVATGLRILVVDDNEINRKLAVILLQQMGASADQATDGVVAVSMCARTPYDLILMDIHMPVMDGLDAAARIRTLEKNRRRTPIIALTANALGGDRERFLAAGMEDYLPKPLNEKALQTVIEKWCRASQVGHVEVGTGVPSRTGPVSPSAVTDDALAILDPHLGTELSLGRAETWRTILDMLVGDLPSAIDQLHSAHAAQDWHALEQIAHRLHGSSSYCGTPALQQAARDLELRARDNRVSAESVERVAAEAYRLLDLVGTMRRKGGDIPLHG